MAEAQPTPLARGTAWTRNLETPLREFLRTETGSAAVLLGAAVAALIWANLAASSYTTLWDTTLSVHLGSAAIGQDLRHWVNSGLMTFFFFVVGLEARREFDLGELRERRRAALPILAGLTGMATAVLIYLAFNAGSGAAGGWGVAMSTDTAFALGVLALVGPRLPGRLRAFMLTVVVVDDLVALVVIATVYSRAVAVLPLLLAIGLLACVAVLRRLGRRLGLIYGVFGLGAWIALYESGVDPVVVGLVLGLMVYAYPAARPDLERASERFRLFREQPTPELARAARSGVESAISPNERLALRLHPWTSYVIVPLFALANAGVQLSGGFLARAFTSPITLGIVVGYVVGKPAGILGASLLVNRVSGGRLRAPVGWAAVAGGGTAAGVGFTVSLLVASLAFSGLRLEEATIGVLSAALARRRLDLGGVSLDRPAAAALPATSAARLVGADRRPGSAGRRRARPRARAARRARDSGRVRRLRVSVLRAGGSVVRELLQDFGRRALRLAASAPERRASLGAACRRSLGSRRGAGRVLGDARSPAGPSGQAARVGPARLRP